MERLKIISDILDGSSTRLRESYFIKNFNDIFNEITDHSVNIVDISFKERLWYWSNNINDEFLCKCGNKTTFNKNWLDGYRKYCSTKCSHSDNITKEKRKATTLAKYGVDNIAKLDSTKKKTEDTNLERYGTKSSFQNKDVQERYKETMNKKYGVNHIFQLDSFKEKAKKTNFKKYGKEYFTQTDKYKEDLIRDNNSKYGTDWYTQTDECKEKTQSTNLERFGGHYSKTDEYKNRVKISNIQKYDKEWYCQSDDFKLKKSNTNLEKYGCLYHSQSLYHKEKIKLLNNLKYGVDWHYQSDDFKEKSKKTNMNRYGIEHYSKTDEFKIRVVETSLEKYGVDNYSKTYESKVKTINKNISKYGSYSISQNEEYRKEKYEMANNENYIKYIDNSISLFNCDCNKNHEFQIHVDNYIKRNKENNPLCTICHPISAKSSIKEKVLYEFIESTYSGEIIPGYRDGLEIDIYLPELKLGFEFNGLYWHSNKYKEKNYHIDKTKHFLDKEIRIVHIWEDDWIFRREVVESQISNLVSNTNIKIFARKCNIAEVDTKESSSFLEENHIQGKVNSSLKLGLFHNEILVSIMTFDHFEGRNLMSDNEWNLNRFCSSRNTNVVGGASKLFEYFVKTYNPSRVISYADRDWSIGNLYYKLGFKKIGESQPDYKYLVDGQRVHKSRYKKSKTKTMLTESKYALENNILKIYDCGKIKFEKMILKSGS